MSAAPLQSPRPGPAPAGRARAGPRGRGRDTLWLAAYLPDLPLEALCRGGPGQTPVAVVEAGAGAVIVAADGPAAARGVRPGMPVQAAWAVIPELRILERDESAENAALEGLAAALGAFSSLVSRVGNRGLVMEIGASLTLFGGLERLRGRVGEGVEALGFRLSPGVAPTPLGAWLLARAGLPRAVLTRDSLAAGLGPVPLDCLDLSARTLARLQGMGLRRLADCLRLPRDGIARRIGPWFLDMLERALGRRPDPRRPHVSAPVFERCVSLPEQTRDLETLLLAVRRALTELTAVLGARQQGVQRLEIHLAHRGSPATRLTLALASPGRDLEHLVRLARERMQGIELPACVEYLGIRAADMVALAPRSGDLYGYRTAPGDDWQALVERLQTRLGEGAVHGVCALASYRPERAWCYCRPGESDTAHDGRPRPLWLLPRPLSLDVRRGRPWYRGRLRLLTGPERLQSGWWDGQDVARDYYTARNPGAGRYWVYQCLRDPSRWYLHGVFA